MNTKIADHPHQRLTIRDITTEQLEMVVQSIRDRRLDPIRVYDEAIKLKQSALKGKLGAKLDKKLAVFKKKLAAIDKAFEALEKTAYELKVLQFEIVELGGMDEEIRLTGSSE